MTGHGWAIGSEKMVGNVWRTPSAQSNIEYVGGVKMQQYGTGQPVPQSSLLSQTVTLSPRASHARIAGLLIVISLEFYGVVVAS
jgi:hypothetical protein